MKGEVISNQVRAGRADSVISGKPRRRLITARIAEILWKGFEILGSLNAVAREFGYSGSSAIGYAFRKHGFLEVGKRVVKESKYSDAQARKWLKDYRRLKSLQKAAALNGVHFMTLYQVLIKRGLIEPRPRTLPEEEVDRIAADYRRLKSLAKVADRCGRTRQSVWEILHARGLTVPKKPGHEKVVYKGENFTVGKNGYLRSTRACTRVKGGSRLLHHVIWEEHHGPIPEGMVIWFTDQSRENCEIKNLECITRKECRRRTVSKNAWTVFYEVHDHLLGEYQEAMRSGDEGKIAEARRNYEALRKPNVWTKRRSVKQTKRMKEWWATKTPADRRAIAMKAHATRRKNRDAKFGTVVDALLAAA